MIRSLVLATVLSCIVIGVPAGCSPAQRIDSISADQVPAPVMSTLEREADGGEVLSRVRWSEDGKSHYTFDVSMGGKIYELKILETGELVGKDLVDQPSADPRTDIGRTQMRQDLKRAGIRNER